MKTVYLYDKNYNWQAFEFEGNIAEALKEALTERNISISYHASIGNDASIGDRASIGHYASIGDRASIGHYASIGHRASIGDDASIGHYASIGDRASIGDGIKLLTGIYFFGSQHSVTYVGDGKISIGCYTYTIERWQESFKIVGQKEGYSPEQITEYGLYIDLIAAYYKATVLNSIPTETPNA